MDEPDTPPQNFSVVAAAFEGSIVVAAVGLGWLLGYAPLKTLSWSWADAGWGLLGVLPPLGVLVLCVNCRWAPLARVIAVLDEVIVPLFAPCRGIEFAVIALLAGLGEEMLFRGVIQTALADWIGGAAGLWIGLMAAAVLFGLAHAVTFAYTVLAALIGLYLGWIWLWTGNLLVPVVAHAGYDFLALLYLVKIRSARVS